MASRRLWILPAFAALAPIGQGRQVLSAELVDPNAAYPAVGFRTAAVSVDRLLVGANLADDAQGRVYAFDRTGSGWSEIAQLVPSGATPGIAFGYSIVLADDAETAVIAATGGMTGNVQSGAAYVFERTGAAWSQTAKLVPGNAAFESPVGFLFGTSLALSGDTLLVGAPNADPFGLRSGSVYWFERNGSGWVEMGEIAPNDAQPKLHFGVSLALDGGTAIAGTIDDPGDYAGKAYVFERTPIGWSQTAVLQPADLDPGDRFGEAIDLHGSRAIIGSRRDDDVAIEAGAAYVFERQGSDWTQIAKLVAADGAMADSFGNSVAIRGPIAIVGAIGADVGNPQSGAAYVFYETPTGWVQAAKLVDPVTPHQNVGARLSFSDGRFAVSSLGTIYVYDFIPLVTDVEQLSVSLGGVQSLAIEAGPEHAGLPYLILGTSSGTGAPLPIDGVTLPLSVDQYTFHTLTNPNQPPLWFSFDVLDNLGRAMGPAFEVPSGGSPAWAGLELHHAYVVIDTDPVPHVTFASKAQSVMLVP